MVDLCRPWTVPVRLVDFHGKYGSRDFRSSGPRYTECRLSRAGEVVLACDRGDMGSVPVGLINGSTYRQGTRPPLQPHRAISALRRVLEDPTVRDSELLEIVGSPDFLDDCVVSGDLGAYSGGHPTALRLTGRVLVAAGEVIIESVPFNSSPHAVMETIIGRMNLRSWKDRFPDPDEALDVPLVGIDDLSDHRGTRLVCKPAKNVDPERLRTVIANIAGVVTEIAVHLPAPLPQLLRSWVAAHRSDQLAAALDVLQAAVGRAEVPRRDH